MKELRRLLSGFLASLMVLSLILAPIPQVDVAWAEETEEVDCEEDAMNEDGSGKIYKPGCELDDTLTKTQLSNLSDYQEGWQGMIQQQIQKLMGVVLINSLRFNYMHKYKSDTYGNDCGQNIAAKFTMRIAQLGALIYIIGDVQANIKFKEAAKKAADQEFSAKEKNYIPDEDSAEVQAAKESGERDPRLTAFEDNNKQVAAYDALIQVLYAQEDAVETKINLTRAQSIANYLAEAIELAGILVCKSSCAKKYAEVAAKAGVAAGSLGGAIPLSITGIPEMYGTAPNPVYGTTCKTLSGNLGYMAAEAGAAPGINEGKAQGKSGKKLGEWIKENLSFTNLIAQLKQFFTPVFQGKSDGSKEVADANVQDKQDQRDQEAQTERQSVDGEWAGQDQNVSNQVSQLKSGTEDCSVAAELAKKGGENWVDYNYTLIPCCGGIGVTKQQANEISNTQDQLKQQLGSISGMDTDQAMSAMNEVSQMEGFESEMSSMDISMDQFSSMAADAQSGLSDLTGSASEFAKASNAGTGSLISWGISGNSIIHKKQDIIVFGLLEKVTKNENLNERELLEAQNFWMKNSFESMLRQHAMANHYKMDRSNPKESLKSILDAETRIQELSHEFHRIISQQNYDVLANGDYKKLPTWQVFMKEVVEFVKPVTDKIIPEAQAIDLGGAAGGMALGMGCSMLANQIQGKWAEILNVGCGIIQLNGLLGKIAREWAFIKPQNRAITWILLAVIDEFIISWDKKALAQIQNNIAIMQKEKERYMNSAATRTSVGKKSRKAGEGALQKYDFAAARSNGQKVRACAVPKGDGFAPSPCPTVVPKKEYQLPQLGNEIGDMMAPEFGDAASFLTTGVYDTVNGNADKSSAFTDSNMEKIDTLSKALASHNSKMRDKIDKLDSKIKAQGGKFKSNSLNAIHKKFSRAFGSGGSGGGGSSLGSTGGSSGGGYYKKPDEEIINNVAAAAPTKAGGRAKLNLPKGGKSKGLDLDFGDDDEDGAGKDYSTTAGASAKKQEKLEDFAIEHNDINKRKDVPIWKILSNRYILSYPKVLDEEDAKLEPEKVKQKKK